MIAVFAVLVTACGGHYPVGEQPKATADRSEYPQVECTLTVTELITYEPTDVDAHMVISMEVVQEFTHTQLPSGQWGYYQVGGEELEISLWEKELGNAIMQRLQAMQIYAEGSWHGGLTYDILAGKCVPFTNQFGIQLVQSWSLQPEHVEYVNGDLRAKISYETLNGIISGAITPEDLPTLSAVGVPMMEISARRTQAIGSYARNTSGVDFAVHVLQLAAMGRSTILYTSVDDAGMYHGVLVEVATGT